MTRPEFYLSPEVNGFSPAEQQQRMRDEVDGEYQYQVEQLTALNGISETIANEENGHNGEIKGINRLFIMKAGDIITRMPHKHTSNEAAIAEGRKAEKEAKGFVPAYTFRAPMLKEFE